MSTQFLSRPGGTIAYDDRGAGPLVVCAPGFGDLRGEYRFLAEQLVAAGFRVVTMDLRGHGESSVGWRDYSKSAVGSDIVALLRHLNADPASVIGNSFAGGAVVCAAAEAPEQIESIVLVDAFVRDHGSAWQRWRSRLLYSLVFAGPWGVSGWKSYYPTLFPTRKPADFSEYFRALLANLREPGRMHAVGAMATASSADSEAALARVQIPALVVMGTRDRDFPSPEQEATWIAGRLHGTAHMIEGAGHYPHVEMPEQTGPAILDFLRQPARHGVAYGN